MNDVVTEYRSEAERVIRNEMRKIPGKQRHTGSSLFIQCPFGKHQDNTPSCGINTALDSPVPFGFVHCFACGTKGPWNVLAQQLGLRTVDRDESTRENVGKINWDTRHRNLLDDEDGYVDVAALVKSFRCIAERPATTMDKWRNIPGKVLATANAWVAVDDYRQELCAVLPVTISDTIVGGIKCAWKKAKGQKSYIYSPGRWIEESLYPFDYAVNMAKRKDSSIVIVEGPRDALRLLRFGIPAVAKLGAKTTWTDHKRDLLVSALDRKVYIMLDGDEAGQLGNEAIANSFRSAKCQFKVLNLARLSKQHGTKIDPGNMPVGVIQQVKRRVIGEA